jgi:hypothetical protein
MHHNAEHFEVCAVAVTRLVVLVTASVASIVKTVCTSNVHQFNRHCAGFDQLIPSRESQ